jgi:hypothetical protein
MVAANDKDLSVCSLNIVISVLLGRVVGNPEVGTCPPRQRLRSSRLFVQVDRFRFARRPAKVCWGKAAVAED